MSLLNIFNIKRTLQPPEKRVAKKEDFCVAGVGFYLENIQKLASTNPEYKKKSSYTNEDCRIYRYNYVNKPVRLVEDPKNPHDKNAIMVIIAGELVGYIRAEECLHVKKILHKHEIKYISSFISGGKYKVVSDGKIVNRDEISISINVRICYV